MQILGVQIDPPFIRLAQVSKNRKGVKILSLHSHPLSDWDHVKPLYIYLPSKKRSFFSTFLLGWFKKGIASEIASGIPAKDLIIKKIELKGEMGSHAEEIVAFQSETTTHLDPDEILTIPFIKKKGAASTEADLFTTKKDCLQDRLRTLQNLQIDPDRISAEPAALCSFITWKMPHLKEAIVLNLGSNECTCVWMEDGTVKKSHAIEEGVESLLQAFAQDRKKVLLKNEVEGAAKQTNLLSLKPHLYPKLLAKLGSLRQSLDRILYSFEQEGGKKTIIFTGQTDAFIQLKQFLVPNTPETNLEEQKFAIAIGLAIEKMNLQFRRGEFFPSKNWIKLGFYSITLLLASFILSASFLVLGMKILKKHEKVLAASIETSLETLDPKAKSHSNISQNMDLWISAINKYNKDYIYIPQAPSPQEMLAWLSAHPLLQKLKMEGDPLSLIQTHYKLVKFPKIGTMKDPYLAKVELEFSFKNPVNARNFHEALLDGDELVDSRSEITWDTLDCGHYRTSFFLKNKGAL